MTTDGNPHPLAGSGLFTVRFPPVSAGLARATAAGAATRCLRMTFLLVNERRSV